MADQRPGVPDHNAFPQPGCPPGLVVDDRPLPPANPWDDDYRSVELAEEDADCLVLRPRAWSALRHALLVLAVSAGSLAVVVFMLLNDFRVNAGWAARAFLVVAALPVFALLLSALFAPARLWVRFDRRTGLMTVARQRFGFLGPLRLVRSCSLADLVCVQLLHGGFRRDVAEVGEPGTPGSVIYSNYASYQLNLVVGGDEPRLNLASNADARWTREAGRRLAEFLKVPLVDQLSSGSPGGG